MISLSQRRSQEFQLSIPHSTGTASTLHVINHDLNTTRVNVAEFLINAVGQDPEDRNRVRDFYRWEPSTYYGYSFATDGPDTVNIVTYNLSQGVTVTGYLILRTY